MDRLKKLRKRWRARRPKLVSGLMHGIVATIDRTLRVETRGFDPSPERTIYCGWHGRSFPFAVHFRDRGWWVIISRSRDGDIQNEIFERLGYRTVRGSTGRGGVRAALSAIRALRKGAVLAMTPDGPRGPAEEVQEGIVLIAQRSDSQIVPVGVAAKPAWTAFESWDRDLVPKPFARAILIAGEPITVSPHAVPTRWRRSGSPFRRRSLGFKPRRTPRWNRFLASKRSTADAGRSVLYPPSSGYSSTVSLKGATVSMNVLSAPW